MIRDYGRLVSLCALALFLFLPLSGGAQVPVGVEFQVNSYTIGDQGNEYPVERPAVAVGPGGDFVVAWTSKEQGGSYPKEGVFAQRFSSAGNPLDSEFQIGSFTSYWGQSRPSMASLGNSGFVVVWQSYEVDGGDNSFGVVTRRYSSTGSPLATELVVNSYVFFDQLRPAVAAAANGDFVVVWDSNFQDGSLTGIFGQRFSSAGDRLGAEFPVNSFFTDSQRQATVAVAPGGSFVVAWESLYQDGSGLGIFGRFFSSSGLALASEFQVSVMTAGGARTPSAAAVADGSFVIAWDSADDGGDYGNTGIFARRLSAAGVPLGDQFQLNAYTTSEQKSPSVVVTGGSFVVAWTSLGQDNSFSYGVFARRFELDGTPLTGDFQVNSYTLYTQRNAAVASTPDGFVVTWVSDAQDGSGRGIFGQRLVVPILLDIDGNGSTSALSDGLLVLRHLFTFTGATLVAGVVDLGGCTRCDDAAIESYLDGLGTALDIDDDGSASALTDGLLVLRYLFGFTGAALTNGAVNLDDCNRCSAAGIGSYLAGAT